ncbi:MAG TPA: Smr/MutS family protein [Blastocatellia bacterium]|nr:Smr/MutS family protein [Blastocatellia bacterium]
MPVASLIEIIRGFFKRRSGKKVSQALDEGAEFDAANPFPETVVIEFRDFLDPHSIPPKQVKAVVEGYLQEAREHQARRVRIIHGKGIGVQREAVRLILARSPLIESFGDAPAELGGWGATLAYMVIDERGKKI